MNEETMKISIELKELEAKMDQLRKAMDNYEPKAVGSVKPCDKCGLKYGILSIDKKTNSTTIRRINAEYCPFCGRKIEEYVPESIYDWDDKDIFEYISNNIYHNNISPEAIKFILEGFYIEKRTHHELAVILKLDHLQVRGVIDHYEFLKERNIVPVYRSKPKVDIPYAEYVVSKYYDTREMSQAECASLIGCNQSMISYYCRQFTKAKIKKGEI